MLKLITKMPIARRLLLAFLLTTVIPGIIISVLGLTFYKGQTERGEIIRLNISAFKSATTAGTYLPDLNALLITTYLEQYQSHQQADKAQVETNIQLIQQTSKLFDTEAHNYQKNYEVLTAPKMWSTQRILKYSHLDPMLPVKQQQDLNRVLHILWPTYQADEASILEAIHQKMPATTVRDLITKANLDYMPLENQWDEVIGIAEKISMRIVTTRMTQAHQIIFLTLIAFFGTIILTTAIGYLAYRSITIPLHQLALMTRRIAKGDTRARATIAARDEIYLVAASMNTMLDNIVRLIQEAEEQRDKLQARVEKLINEVSSVGDGNLCVQAEVDDSELGILADSFNYMIEALGSLVVRVKSVAGEVASSTSKILNCMTQLVETDNNQLQQIARASAEIEQVAASSRNVAERTRVLFDVANIARQDTQLGREAIEQVMDGMGRINNNVQITASKVHTLGDHSREIDEVIEVISSIAHQTNRLALDAAIQSAMAGENGKGFGAVAADIRRLAERTKDQAHLITRIVRSIREEIGTLAISMQDTEKETTSGSQLTQETGVALQSIFTAIEHQAKEIEMINQMVAQQLQSSTTVVHIMENVAETTQQSSANTRDASQHVERLARQVRQLRTSVEAFKLREGHNYQIPTTSATINWEEDEEPESPLTISGVFRTVSATLRPVARNARRGAAISGIYFAPPDSSDDYRCALPGPHETSNSGQNWDRLPQSEEWQSNKPIDKSGTEW
ncbi:methyl-accepting chemotaxis protein [Dictyobacter aurantiacus]|uniref:Methyl-accepting chemotaxis protein n=1 Tax=Dictyobacter aurantiacus TaxID=1936993 RepID=A0A401ZC97_9CHLR|nr:methyl-accepting chemotaxis protein [Dictyobacter aurantiacus]GCE04521.1 hypothetical protein KDAU_18500 [Dictyobacter aurantiacus]